MEFERFGYNWKATNLLVKLTRECCVELATNKTDGGHYFGNLVCDGNFGHGVYEWMFTHPVFPHCVFSLGLICGDVRLLIAEGSMSLYPNNYKKNFLKTSIQPQVWRDGEDMTAFCKVRHMFNHKIKTGKPNRYFLIWSERCVKVFFGSVLVMETNDENVMRELNNCNGKMTPYVMVGYTFNNGEVNHIASEKTANATVCWFEYRPFDE